MVLKGKVTAPSDRTKNDHLRLGGQFLEQRPDSLHHRHDPAHEKFEGTMPGSNLRLSFNMLRLVLDDITDHLSREVRSLSESEKEKIAEFAHEFQELFMKSAELKDMHDQVVRSTSRVVVQAPGDVIREDDISDMSISEQANTVHGGREEFEERLVAIFRKLDADGNQSLSAEELRRAMLEADVPAARLKKMIKMADVNGNGQIELNEWIEAVRCASNSKDIGMLQSSLSRKFEHGGLFDSSRISKLKYVFHPTSKIRVAFDTVVFLTCCYLGVVSPFSLAWEKQMSSGTVATFRFIDLLIMILFTVDIVLSFFTGYVNAEDEVVLDQRLIAQKYLKTWFPLDFVSTFPFEFVGIESGKHMQAIKVLKLVKILKIVKLLAQGQVDWSEYSEVLDDISTSKFAQMLQRRSSVLIYLTLVCHWMACGMKMVESDSPGALHKYLESSYGDTMKEYLAALYWAMTTLTTVGYGDILPTSDGERVYTILAMVVGGGFYGYVVGSICSMVASSDLNTSAYFDHMELIHAWVNHHRLPRQMKRRLKRYFKVYLSEKSAINEAEVWHDLTPELQREVGEYIIQKDVVHNPIFDGLAMGTVVRLQSILQKISAPMGSIIVQQGEAGTAMYILLHGSAQLSVTDQNNERSVTDLGIGESFGEEILLGLEENYQYTVTIMEKSRMQMILEDDFCALWCNQPNVVEKMRRNAIELRPEWGMK